MGKVISLESYRSNWVETAPEVKLTRFGKFSPCILIPNSSLFIIRGSHNSEFALGFLCPKDLNTEDDLVLTLIAKEEVVAFREFKDFFYSPIAYSPKRCESFLERNDLHLDELFLKFYKQVYKLSDDLLSHSISVFTYGQLNNNPRYVGHALINGSFLVEFKHGHDNESVSKCPYCFDDTLIKPTDSSCPKCKNKLSIYSLLL